MPIGTTAAILAASLAGTAGSVAGGLANKSKTQTGTSSTTTTLPPELQGFQSDLVGRIMARMNNPAGGNVDILRTQGLDKVNKVYNAMPQRLTEQFSGRGFGSSGSLNDAILTSERDRAGSLGDVEAHIADLVNGNEKDAMSLGASVLSGARGSSTNSSTTMPGSSAAGAISGGINGIMSGILLKQLLSGGK